MLALDKGWGHGWIQIGPSVCTSIAEIAETVVKISGKDITPLLRHHQARGGQGPQRRLLQSQELLGWEPKVSLEEGLRSQYAWIKNRIENEAE